LNHQKNYPIVTIERLSHDGRGIAHLAGKTIFVEGGLVGEAVEIDYLKRRPRWDEARTVLVHKAVPDRKVPACEFFTLCGGCSLQHMSGPHQILHKQEVLLEQLQHIGGIQPKKILLPITASAYGYRRKARLGVRYVMKKNKLLIGFREKNNRYLADIERCPVLDPRVGEKIPLIRDFLLKLKAHLHIPQLEIAVGDTQAAIILRHLIPFCHTDQKIIREFAQETGYSIYLQPGGPMTATPFYPAETARLSYRLDDYNMTLLFHPTDFIQVNNEINKKLIKMAITLLNPKPHEIMLDLFCGIGNFTLPLARFCKQARGVEGSESMVARGYENARHNNITNVEFYCQNLGENNYTNSMLANATGILLDPARAGAWDVIQHLPHSSAERIVYVSCNPATLAKDAGYLCQHGFELALVGVLDMFPHTSHVESIALFNRV
jgi:23S rRNA (uracil1939-C5)-methyltransferase